MPRTQKRRDFLCSACAAAAALFSTGCAREKADAGPRVDAARLSDGGRVVVFHETIPVEVSESPDGIVARSLLCTHQGCVVEWQPDRREYDCPCHEATFDENGVPIAGPATRSLRRFPTRTDGSSIVVIMREGPA